MNDFDTFDYIIAGGGAAGLSLALSLSRSKLNKSKILIVDRDKKNKNDHTWCFWANQSPIDEQVVFKKWTNLDFIGKVSKKRFALQPYSYYMVRGIDFYNFTKAELQKNPNLKFLIGSIEEITEDGNGATVMVESKQYRCRYCFDSRFDNTNFKPDPLKFHYLKQHFWGWEIETPNTSFDPSSAILFDFRTEQYNDMRFFYTLPINEKRALIEYTIFSENLLKKEEYIHALEIYIKKTLGIHTFYLNNEESGIIPMTDFVFQRRLGRHILAIGTAGGLVKASTGYAFLRILKDSEAIVKSLITNGHPFDIPKSPQRYQVFDRVMLHVMKHNGEISSEIFTDLFTKNPIHRLFGFLDEVGDIRSNLKLMSTLPLIPFIKSYIQTIILKKS